MSDGYTDMMNSGDSEQIPEQKPKKVQQEDSNHLDTIELPKEGGWGGLYEQIVVRLTELLPPGTPTDFLDEAARLYCALPYTKPGMKLCDDNILFVTVFPFLAEIQYKKEQGYGRSWCKRGEMDIFFNTARKFDRIENIVLGTGQDQVGEATIDTVGDMANYTMLWMTYYLRVNTDVFLSWAKNN
jgi:hypothetical protein